jgi:hypothetical protein
MRRTRFIALCLSVALLAACGCSEGSKAQAADAGTLTNELAQKAINQWLLGNGVKLVQGVHEIPAENAATADVELTNFEWNSPKNDAVTAYAFGPGGGSHVYEGHATAYFLHYTDGRWVLMRVRGPFGTFDDLNISVQ